MKNINTEPGKTGKMVIFGRFYGILLPEVTTVYGFIMGQIITGWWYTAGGCAKLGAWRLGQTRIPLKIA